MSADAFLVCYGVCWEVDASDDTEIERLERRQDPRQRVARDHGLESWWGPTVDEERYFLLVGRLLGRFGWEGKSREMLSATQAAELVADVEKRLREAGMEDEPAWHFQFEPDR